MEISYATKTFTFTMSRFLFIAAMFFAAAFTTTHGQELRVGFYSQTCPSAESIIRSTVEDLSKIDNRTAPRLLRMHFHDCFVLGCDASVLLNGTDTEKTSFPNQGLRGYELVDEIKTRLEAACPGVVSCADILALAARDAVVLTMGKTWAVPTGRRDGRISRAADSLDLPGFHDSVADQKRKFAAVGLDTNDMVTLVGSHSIGTTACFIFRYRIYNFTGTGNGTDPSIAPSFAATMSQICPRDGDPGKRISLDYGSQLESSESFYANLRDGRGVLESDQNLWGDAETRSIAQGFLGGSGSQKLNFHAEFAKAMVKMGNIAPKTGTEGEIRKVCSAGN